MLREQYVHQQLLQRELRERLRCMQDERRLLGRMGHLLLSGGTWLIEQAGQDAAAAPAAGNWKVGGRDASISHA
jgi:hypothetical protein